MRTLLTQRGSALVEVLIASLIVSFAISIASVSLFNASKQRIKGAGKEEAALYTQELLERLRNYVTADAVTANPSAPGGSWVLPGDPCNCWALTAGAHDATATLPAEFRLKHQATLKYFVTVETIQGQDIRSVRAELEWNPSL